MAIRNFLKRNDNLEIQIVEMNGRLQEHIALTHSILEYQKSSLEILRDDISINSEKYVTYDAMNLLAETTLKKSEVSARLMVNETEARITRTFKQIGTVVATVILLGIGLVEVVPLLTTSGGS